MARIRTVKVETVTDVFRFIIATSNDKGRRTAHPKLVSADMMLGGWIDPESYDAAHWRFVDRALAILESEGSIEIQHGPETEVYGDSLQPMIQVNKWRSIRPTRAHIPLDVRRVVYERDNFACRQCGAGERLSLDHIIPWSLGGSDESDNLQTLCVPCNSSKGAR